MPAVSKDQQVAAAIALHAPERELKGSSKQMRDSMTEAQLREFAETKHEGLPKEKGDAEKKAFVSGFLSKCASLNVDPSEVTKMVYAMCSRDSDARDAFVSLVKESAAAPAVEKVRYLEPRGPQHRSLWPAWLPRGKSNYTPPPVEPWYVAEDRARGQNGLRFLQDNVPAAMDFLKYVFNPSIPEYRPQGVAQTRGLPPTAAPGS